MKAYRVDDLTVNGESIKNVFIPLDNSFGVNDLIRMELEKTRKMEKYDLIQYGELVYVGTWVYGK